MHLKQLPHCLKCGLKKYLMEYELWMSAGGTSSLLHSHADHHLHCLLTGRKDFIIIHPDMKPKLHIIDKV
jgi:lysine-specific demethylase 8